MGFFLPGVVWAHLYHILVLGMPLLSCVFNFLSWGGVFAVVVHASCCVLNYVVRCTILCVCVWGGGGVTRLAACIGDAAQRLSVVSWGGVLFKEGVIMLYSFWGKHPHSK